MIPCGIVPRRVHFGDDQRDVRVHSERRAVVDDEGAVLSDLGRVLAGELGGDREEAMSRPRTPRR